jgi:outer membrane protein assembly factor BamA
VHWLGTAFRAGPVLLPFFETKPRQTGSFAPRTIDALRIARKVATQVVLAAVSCGAFACSKIPPGQSAIDAVAVEGADGVSASDTKSKIATSATPKFLGLFRGIIYDYEIFDRYVLAEDLARVERYYRSRGYYEVHARTGRVEQRENHVRVTIVVDEGPLTRVRTIRLEGLEALPRPIQILALERMHDSIKEGQPFDEDHFKDGDAAMTHTLTDGGYAFATIDRKADVDIVQHAADLVYRATPGKLSTYGKITVEGLGSLSAAPVLRALDLQEGKPYSRSDLIRAQQAALDLGVFSSVEVTPELATPPPPSYVVPIHVRVEQTRLRGVKLGGGLELDVIKTDVHALLGWEDRNFFGGMRRFTIETRPGLVLFPTRIPNFDKPTSLLPEERTRMEFHQPGFIEARTSGLVQGEFNIGPILLTPNPPSSPVLGYRETKGAVGLERAFWKVYAKLTQNVQDENPFAYIGSIDPALSDVVIAYPELTTTLDLRDDKAHPRHGIYLTNSLQVAGDGGTARDVRVRPELRTYIPVVKGITLGLRGTLGFLFPFNYGSTEPPSSPPMNASPGQTSAYEDARTAWVHDAQIVFFRGFFSGGPSSNRGYPLFGVGPHGPAPFYNQSISYQEATNGCSLAGTAAGSSSSATIPPQCYVPLGGSTLWEASVEMRFHVAGPIEIATFCDAGDVSSRTVDIRLNHPHLSCGPGVRYDTPVGPIRLDIGYRIPGLQYPGQGQPAVDALEGNDDLEPGGGHIPGTILGLPIAIAFGIGESF